MRPLAWLLVGLVAVVGVGLGLRVMSDAAPATVPAANDAPTTRGGVPQGHVYTGCCEEPGDINPFTAHAPVPKRMVLAYTHEALLRIDPASGELVPCIAEHFAPSADGRSCTFTLRADVRFADGATVTLDDVLFGWELESANRVHRQLTLGFVDDAYSRVERVERLDDRRFTVHFNDSHYAVLRVVGESWLVAQKKFFVDRVAERTAPAPAPAVDSAAFAHALAQLSRECGPGTGPFRFAPGTAGGGLWRPGQELVLTVNEHAWRRHAQPGTWNFAGLRLLFREPGAAQNTLLRHELDWYSTQTLDSLLAEHPDLLTAYQRLEYDYEALGVFRVVWHCGRGPTADPRVRRALAMLFDVDGLRTACAGLGPRALAHAKPESGAYPRDVVPLPYDPAAARRLLREAGYDPEQGKPLQIRVLALEGTEVFTFVTDGFRAAADAAGVELDLRRRSLAAFLAEKKLDAWHGLLVQQQFKAWGDPWEFLHSAGADNEGRWSNAEADRLADQARVTADPAARDALWRQLHTIAYREQPATLLAHPLVVMLLHRRVEGAVPSRLGLDLERAFVPHHLQRR